MLQSDSRYIQDTVQLRRHSCDSRSAPDGGNASLQNSVHLGYVLNQPFRSNAIKKRYVWISTLPLRTSSKVFQISCLRISRKRWQTSTTASSISEETHSSTMSSWDLNSSFTLARCSSIVVYATSISNKRRLVCRISRMRSERRWWAT